MRLGSWKDRRLESKGGDEENEKQGDKEDRRLKLVESFRLPSFLASKLPGFPAFVPNVIASKHSSCAVPDIIIKYKLK
jgi:hypothetical protein